MSTIKQRIIEQLENHGIDYKWSNGDLIVKEVYTFNGVASYKWRNTDHWSFKDFTVWLEY